MGAAVFEVSGHAGSLAVGHQVAAELGPWRLVMEPRLPRSYALAAQVTAVSEFWIRERPLTLTLEVGPHRWAWTGVEPAIDGAALTLSVAGIPTIFGDGSGSWNGNGRREGVGR